MKRKRKGKKSWTFHRPAVAQPAPEPKRPRDTGRWTFHEPEQKPAAAARWVFHEPGTPLRPELEDWPGWRWEGPERIPGTQFSVPLGVRWTCDYRQRDGTSWGCKSFVWEHDPEPGQFHAWDCPYWQHAGQQVQPF